MLLLQDMFILMCIIKLNHRLFVLANFIHVVSSSSFLQSHPSNAPSTYNGVYFHYGNLRYILNKFAQSINEKWDIFYRQRVNNTKSLRNKYIPPESWQSIFAYVPPVPTWLIDVILRTKFLRNWSSRFPLSTDRWVGDLGLGQQWVCRKTNVHYRPLIEKWLGLDMSFQNSRDKPDGDSFRSIFSRKKPFYYNFILFCTTIILFYTTTSLTSKNSEVDNFIFANHLLTGNVRLFLFDFFFFIFILVITHIWKQSVD